MTKLAFHSYLWDGRMFLRRIVADEKPSDAPDGSADSEKVKDPFPAPAFGNRSAQ